MRSLVIGRGQLGGAVADCLPGVTTIADVPWNDTGLACDLIVERVVGFLAEPGPATVLWCAGAGVVGTSAAALADERSILQAVLDAGAGAPGTLDRFFLASSAGGVYAGNEGLCTEQTEPIPISDYGRSKLIQEQMVTEWAHASGVHTLIGRISNLYGPRQDRRKPQGFISHLLAAMLAQRPFLYTVPASTLRDFVYADDVGARLARWATHARNGPSGVQLKILSSDQSVSLAHVATMAGHVTRRPPRVLFARRPGSGQPAAVRVRTSVDVGGLPDRGNRPLEHGLWLTWQALLRSNRSDR